MTREILTGIPVIRAFSREKHEEERFEEANERLTKTNLFVNRCHDIYDADDDAYYERRFRSDYLQSVLMQVDNGTYAGRQM